jgi:hypothetical protein
MARITEKGITTVPTEIRSTYPVLYAWLSNLQLIFPKISTYEALMDLANIGATSYSTQIFTVTGLDVRDVIIVNPPALTSGLYLLSYYVSAANTLSLTFYNSTVGGINEAAATYKIMACRI